MKTTYRKIKFGAFMLFFPFRHFIEKMGIGYDTVKAINDFYREKFNRASLKESAVMLPHCLIDDQCPAKFSKEEGILCIKCKRCRCGEIKLLCEEKGMQFYISPSSGFSKRLARRKNLQATIGAACSFEIEKGLTSIRLTGKGVHLEKGKLIPHIILADKYDCLKNDIDWEHLKKIITHGA